MSALSDHLFVVAVFGYALAMLAYAAETTKLGQSRRDHHRQVEIPVEAVERVLVGAGGPGDADGDEGVVPSMPRRPSPHVPEPPTVVGRIAVALTVVAALVHAGSLVTRGLADGDLPWTNMYGFASAGAFAVAGSYLVLLTRQRVRWLGLAVTFAVVVTMGLAGTVLYTDAGPVQAPLRSYWLAIHVSAAILSSGVFTIGSSCAALYLLKLRADERELMGNPVRWAGFARRLPPAATLDRTAYRVLAFAFPLWTFAVIAGAIWAESAWGRYWGWDPKETWAFITWVIYAAYLHARSTAGWAGRRAAWIAVVGFAAFLFNFFGVNIFITGLHSYAGI